MGGRKTVALAEVSLLEPDVQEQYGPEHAVMVGQAQHMPSTSYPDPACGQQPPRRKRKRPSATSAPLSSPQQIPNYKLFFGCVERCRYLRSSGQKTEYLLAARLPKQHGTGELMLRWFEELPDPATMQQQLIPWASRALVQRDMQLPMQSRPQRLAEHSLKAFVQPLSNPHEKLSAHLKVCDGSFVDVVTFHHVPAQKCIVLDYDDEQHCFGFVMTKGRLLSSA
ncbi:hypothetical protein WJX74_004907 [Apatococcus lobatus]|uniref:Uncharacterized protein n=1 Tax=Apatococcus lobatus TaxID=904363 RepID=A0AAW1RWI8_9CHLO